jgi:NhaP-type Na+/H+ or K+/H+ antiporter
MKRLFLIIAIICSFLPWAAGAAPQTEQSPHTEHIAHHASESAHDSAMAPLFFVIIALAIGAATRHFLKKTPLPYTVLLMMLGLGIGTLSRLEILELLHLSYLNASVSWAGNIDPHVILFVFLPILVFEAAFAMDVHIFKNTLANATLLAVPGIVLAMFFTAGITMVISYFQWGLGGWNWEIAFMFGAVVSATDPVAVVSLLKELGASKKLGMLIEGESLLNDGTAIVLFMGFFLAMTGQATGNSALYDFVRVSAGGLAVGLVVAYVTIQWVKNVFNDAMVEITLIIASAYLCFFIAEHFFHVSGVLALVSFGLMMSGIGRTRISPEVEHFLHEFWELAAFIANTLIFIIVGVVIAQKTVFSATDFIVLSIMYIGIHIARIVMVAGHYPIMKNIGYGINMKDAAVLCWGGLRGAIALALALVVNGADSSYISDPVKHQFLFLTAGIVTLTLLINATTVGWAAHQARHDCPVARQSFDALQCGEIPAQQLRECTRADEARPFHGQSQLESCRRAAAAPAPSPVRHRCSSGRHSLGIPQNDTRKREKQLLEIVPERTAWTYFGTETHRNNRRNAGQRRRNTAQLTQGS